MKVQPELGPLTAAFLMEPGKEEISVCVRMLRCTRGLAVAVVAEVPVCPGRNASKRN